MTWSALENYGVVFSGIQVVEISPCLRMAKAENQRGLIGLALQLPFCFEVRALGGSLVSSAPERPCDDVCGLNPLSSKSDGNTADFLD